MCYTYRTDTLRTGHGMCITTACCLLWAEGCCVRELKGNHGRILAVCRLHTARFPTCVANVLKAPKKAKDKFFPDLLSFAVCFTYLCRVFDKQTF